MQRSRDRTMCGWWRNREEEACAAGAVSVGMGGGTKGGDEGKEGYRGGAGPDSSAHRSPLSTAKTL